ncbi:DMATS type aromatic prenyltransferase [Streptomyces sp. B4I13]|uniref:tryptophan dimethylallyltransferase family protein n=1 Tax=Streptomyces sp. B4I13 TaxID=3042271 RepID=UPI00278119BF|nr:tryptophan dimethylallyltransferase family protein [Streptomyces sp. B4I13]MDQ0957678.1 DMATS type aromatic prenyltransferase [Streptomyces sp. B4I13]
MTASRPGFPGEPAAGTLGGHAARQLLRLSEIAGLPAADSEVYARTLLDVLGPIAQRPLELPPPSRSFLSDDHTPVEFSLSCEPGAPPTLRVLLEPGAGAGDLTDNGRTGLRVIREMGRRWGFGTAPLDDLEDLFFPPSPQGPLALWCALELRAGGVPKVKVYLNPAASGEKRAAKTVRQALERLGHRTAFQALPDGDRHLFFALDLGDWAEPRVKVYLAHDDLSAAEAGALCRTGDGPGSVEIEEFFRIVAGEEHKPQLDRRPVQTCHAFTETRTGLPSGFTVYIPVRDYARHDGVALDRAAALHARYGIDPVSVRRASAAVTSRQMEDGVGLVAYLGLARQRGRPPRVMTYISSEAYEVRPPTVLSPDLVPDVAPPPAPVAAEA